MCPLRRGPSRDVPDPTTDDHQEDGSAWASSTRRRTSPTRTPQIEEGIDRATDVAEDRLGDEVGTDQIESAAEKAKDAVDELADS